MIKVVQRLVLAVCALVAVAAVLPSAMAQRGGGVRPQGDREPAPIPAPKSREDMRRGGQQPGPGELDFPPIYRSIDGTGNHLREPEWGAADIEFLRLTTVDYADGANEPSGADRPSAREVSNACATQTGSIENRRGATDYLWQWGQFLDHDIDETPGADPAEAFDIAVPAGDPFFDPFNTGVQVIPLNRSAYHEVGGVRQQINGITAYIDASNVYGSNEERADALRANDGTGRLATSDGDLLPFNDGRFPNAEIPNGSRYFLAGDVRANEQIGLIAMHTLFVREHNFWADTIRSNNAGLSGDEIYEMARAIVGAEMQVITYKEFLPVLLGPDAIPPYRGFEGRVNPGIANVFATAAYRVGHTMLSTTLLRQDGFGNSVGDLSLADAFFAPQEIVDLGIDPVLRGLAAQRCQEIDMKVIDDVRNFLFGPPGAGGFDLASLNIQRGRDHGLPSYNQVRRDYGLRPLRSFDQIHPDPSVGAALASVYDSIENVDAWVGMLAERHAPGAMVGQTLQVVLGDQFRRLRDGDRFWYQNHLPRSLVEVVERQTLARIIRRNTEVESEIQGNVFLVPNRDGGRPQGPPQGGGGSGGPRPPRGR